MCKLPPILTLTFAHDCIYRLRTGSLNKHYVLKMRRDSVVGIANPYGLRVRGSIPGRFEILRTRPDRPWSPPSLLNNGQLVYFAGVKRPGCDADHPPPSSAEVKERVELYLHSPYAFKACSRVNFLHLPLLCSQTALR
jgi:hypothetical protein